MKAPWGSDSWLLIINRAKQEQPGFLSNTEARLTESQLCWVFLQLPTEETAARLQPGLKDIKDWMTWWDVRTKLGSSSCSSVTFSDSLLTNQVHYIGGRYKCQCLFWRGRYRGILKRPEKVSNWSWIDLKIPFNFMCTVLYRVKIVCDPK